MILNIDKSGVVSETKILSDKVSELYKKLGYKTVDKMEEASAIWSEGMNHIHVYGKTKGRAGSENKYEFPPPIDGTLFFGNVLIVLVSDDKIVDLTLKVWEVVYERLLGGFEDLVDSDGNALSEDEDSEEDCEDLEGVKYTKAGYVKDDFIVDDSDDLEEEEDYELPKKKKVAAKKVAIAVVAKKVAVSVSVDSDAVVKKETEKKPKKKSKKVEEEVAEKEPKKKSSKKKVEEVAEEVSVKKEPKKKASKKKVEEVKEKVEEIVEKKPKKESSRKKKVLPSLESAVFDEHEEELETLGHISEELAEEEYV
jgi:hypothetical protein